jgi:DNA polymerase-3 subunit delta'
MLYSNVVGQDDVKSFLIKSIQNNQVSHCYIFEGPKDMGKYELALIFAQSLLCSNFKDGPCNSCDSCIKVNTMNHPDLHVINKEDKTIKREDIDELIESIYKKSYQAGRKVYIINNAQDMTMQAANTFLKTLEEPPGNSTIILLTDNASLLLPTILSRCQIVKFNILGRNDIAEYLMENCNAGKDEANLAANYSKGILNKSVKIISGSDGILEKRKKIIELFDRILRSDEEIIFELENYFEENKDDIDTIIEIMMIWVRDIIFVKNGMDDLAINRDLTELAKLQGSRLTAEGADELIRYLQSVSDSIKSNVNYKLLIDKMLLKIQEEFI